jgi:hypothetical protein
MDGILLYGAQKSDKIDKWLSKIMPIAELEKTEEQAGKEHR